MKSDNIPTSPLDLINKKYFDSNISTIFKGGKFLINEIKLTNLIINGDFSDGSIKWESHQSGVIDVIGSRLRVVANPTNYSGVKQTINRNVNKGDVFYSGFTVDNPNDYSISLNLQFIGRTYYVTVPPKFKGILSSTQAFEGNLTSIIYYITKTDAYSDAFTFFVDDVVFLNLSEIFGAGNEPSKETIDNLIKRTGYFTEKTVTYGEFI